jgi:hypothetical protein
MSLATCLVTLNTKLLNLTKVEATQLTSVKEGIIPFSLFFFRQKVISNLMKFSFEHPL